MDRDDARGEEQRGITPPHGDPLMPPARGRAERKAAPVAANEREQGIENVPSSGSEEPERMGFSDPLPVRSHSLDPSVLETEESREQAPPSPDWLEPGRA